MKVFFDSSSFAKRFIQEEGSETVDLICQEAKALGLSVICFPEIVSALNRKLREKNFNRQSYVKIKHQLAEDIRDIQVVNLLPAVIEQSILLLESNVLRSLDALHVACAMEWQTDLFVSSDTRQIRAAENAGLRTKYI